MNNEHAEEENYDHCPAISCAEAWELHRRQTLALWEWNTKASMWEHVNEERVKEALARPPNEAHVRLRPGWGYMLLREEPLPGWEDVLNDRRGAVLATRKAK